MSVTEIAKRAGVSIATVSRVVNNSRPVRPDVAAQVRRAMEELQLVPKKIRRRSSSTINTTVAIVSLGHQYRGWFDTGIIATVVGELTRAAQEMEMGVQLVEMPDPTQVPSVLRRNAMIGGAIVFMAGGLNSHAAVTLNNEMPIVRVMGGEVGPLTIDQIGVDNSAVGFLAADYLLSQGVRQLGFMTFSPVWGVTQLRSQGLLAGAVSAGVPCQSYLLGNATTPREFFGINPIVETTADALVARLATNIKGSGRVGLFVSRDEETVHVYRLLAEHGLRPQEDVLVVSCDNEEVRLSTLFPRPASIDLSATEIARRAVRRLATRIKHHGEPPVRILVNPHLALPKAAVVI